MYKIVIRLNITYCKLGFAIRVDVNVTFALDFPESKCWPGLHRDLLWIQIMPTDSARVAENWHPAIVCWTCRDCLQESIIFQLEIQFGGWRVQNNLELWLKCNQEWQFVGILKRSNPIWKEGNIKISTASNKSTYTFVSISNLEFTISSTTSKCPYVLKIPTSLKKGSEALIVYILR